MKNYLHLDFKGIVPSLNKFYTWLDFFRECGFEGLVFEYDCRVKWDAWPGCEREAFTKDEIKKLLDYAHSIGFETIPLIQVLGHLEWALAKPAYADLREADYIDEICPLNPAAKQKILTFLDEVMELHQSKFIHLGADETWYLGSCAKCQAAAANDARKQFGAYIDYIADICQYIISKNVRPMIWADVFCWNNHIDAVKQLPPSTIAVDWEYGAIKYWEHIAGLPIETWGASALQCGYYEHWWRTMDNPAARLKNIADWQQTGASIIHTVWGRPASLWNLYPGWHGLIPLFIAAGNPQKWLKHPWHDFINNLSMVMLRNWPPELEKTAEAAKNLPCQNDFERQYLQFLQLSLRYQKLEKEHRSLQYGKTIVQSTRQFIDADEPSYYKYYVKPLPDWKNQLADWKNQIETFFSVNELSDFPEFIAEKTAIFHDGCTKQN